jgi:GntR family transcriptional regulator
MSETRYAQVARDLTEGIQSGRFPMGSLLLTELELCAQYGASRNTVRTALRELQELGLVSRRERAGTRVEAASAARGYSQSLTQVPIRLSRKRRLIGCGASGEAN